MINPGIRRVAVASMAVLAMGCVAPVPSTGEQVALDEEGFRLTLPPGWDDGTGRNRKQAAAVLVCNMPGSTGNPNIVENISKSFETPNIQIGDDCATAIAQLLNVSFKLVEVRNLLALTQLYVFRK